MPGNVGAIQGGLQYQELYGWYRVLDLKSPAGKVRTVTIEDPAGGFFDDVVLRPAPATAHASEYLQVKFHVDLTDAYSSTSLMAENHGLLLRKAWRTWQRLRDEPGLELHLITTWDWDRTDPLAPLIRDRRLSRAFIEGDLTGTVLGVRNAWYEFLDSPDGGDFAAFLSALRLRTSYPATGELLDLVTERMQSRGLKSRVEDAWAGAGAVRQWMIDGRKTIDEALLDAEIERLGLRDTDVERSVTLWVHTVMKPFDVAADYELDWLDLFEGPEDERGHRMRDPDDWNGRLMAELRAMSARIKAEADGARLLRLRGQSRLSPWFAVGYTFRETTGWTLEVSQGGHLWRTDAPASAIDLLVTREDRNGPDSRAAIAVSVTGDALPAVRRHLEQQPASRLVVVSVATPGRTAISSGGDLTAIADAIRGEVLALDPRPADIALYYFGPAAGAVFIGHALNGLAPRIHLFEEEFGAYEESIILGASPGTSRSGVWSGVSS
jgi:hypothetical protein